MWLSMIWYDMLNRNPLHFLQTERIKIQLHIKAEKFKVKETWIAFQIEL
jgi:hypothetical protein